MTSSRNKVAPGIFKFYRDVMLSDCSGKSSVKLVRGQFMPFGATLVGKIQFGSGFNGGETAVAHLYIRGFADSLDECNCSGSRNVLDVVNAFASLSRRILLSVDESDEAWIKQLIETWLTHEQVKAGMVMIAESFENHIDDGGYEPADQHAYTEAQYTNSWFS